MPPKELDIVGDYLWDRAYAQAVDRLTTERYKLPAAQLMEQAGRGVAQAILDAGAVDAPIVVLAGAGNNGGDALVAARWLAEAGCDVHVFRVERDPDQALSPLCAQQTEILGALEIAVTTYRRGALAQFAGTEPVIVDGVLGLGATGPLAPSSLLHAALTEAATLEDATVVAVDLPSGLDADVGDAQQVPLPADVTITFGGKKPAHVLAPARDVCGEVICLDIGFPGAAVRAALLTHTPGIVQPDPAALLRINPWDDLPVSAHKYDRGHVLVLGGSPGKSGAPLLAGLAALRAGAGWVTIAMPESALATLRGDVPRELVFEALFDGEQLNPLKLERFLKSGKVRAVVAGPGATRNPLDADTLAVLAAASAESGLFVVADAGATHGLAARLPELALDPEHWLLTPHPGEWRKLGDGWDESPLTPAAFKRAAARVEALGVAVLYKNATPLLLTGNPATPGFVIAEGSLALARAGSGDVFAGVAGAHGAIGLSSAVAALRGQVQVAWAARLAAADKGTHAVLARDIMEQLGRVAELAEEEDEEDAEDEDDEHDEGSDDH